MGCARGSAQAPNGARGERRAAWALVVLAGPLSAGMLLAVRLGSNGMAAEIRETVLGADVGDPALGRRELFLLQAENGLVPFSFASTWAVETDDHDVRVHVLHMGRRGLAWRRIDERTFEIESTDEPFLTEPFEVVYLAPDGPPAAGTRFDRDPFDVTVLAAEERGVRSFRVVLDEPIDPLRHRFLLPREGRLVAVPAPAPGETTILPAIVPPHPFVP